MPSKEYRVNTTGRRNLRLSKQDDGTYQARVMLGEDRQLAVLVFTQKEWAKLASFSEGLKRK